jgi:hypothetical protein
MTLSIGRHYVDSCNYLNVMVGVVMLSVITLNVIMLRVVAPFSELPYIKLIFVLHKGLLF